MKILVIGGGGREHALVWKLSQSPTVEKVWCAPGNGGISEDAECLPADTNDIGTLAALADRLKPDLTVVGPEQPLVLGLTDALAERGLPVFGPSRQAAEIEGSKIFAKEFLERHHIPTAPLYGAYDSPGEAYGALCAVDWPVVIKADGLCGGKGVLVAPTPDDATAFIDRLMEKHEFGPGGNRILLEEALEGEELSFIVVTDGTTVLPLAPTRDHKRVFDGNRGPNTGGMGAYSSEGLVSPALEKQILDTIVHPTVQAMRAEGRPYRGFLYFGLMLTADGPKVLEFNCRMGDPETQPLVMRMDFDLAETLAAAAGGELARSSIRWTPGASICAVMAAAGYPGPAQTGEKIDGLDEVKRIHGVKVFHAGTRREQSNYYTCSGRVLGVTATGPSLPSAIERCYGAVGKVRFPGAHYRTDIGQAKSGAAAGRRP